MKFGICILAGGKSSRMKFPKADLRYKDKTFIEILVDELKGFDNKYISINSKQSYMFEGYQTIVDEYESIGPMNGIVSCFHQSDMDALFVCSCDMPFIKKEIVHYLLSNLETSNGIFLKDEKHTYMTAGIYTRKILPVFEEQIGNKDYRLYKSLRQCDVKFIDVDSIEIDTNYLLNINTIDDYKRLEEVLSK